MPKVVRPKHGAQKSSKVIAEPGSHAVTSSAAPAILVRFLLHATYWENVDSILREGPKPKSHVVGLECM